MTEPDIVTIYACRIRNDGTVQVDSAEGKRTAKQIKLLNRDWYSAFGSTMILPLDQSWNPIFYTARDAVLARRASAERDLDASLREVAENEAAVAALAAWLEANP